MLTILIEERLVAKHSSNSTIDRKGGGSAKFGALPFVNSPKARRIEARFPDPVANPYLAFAALMMAGLDGVQNRIHPGDPAEKQGSSLGPILRAQADQRRNERFILSHHSYST